MFQGFKTLSFVTLILEVGTKNYVPPLIEKVLN